MSVIIDFEGFQLPSGYFVVKELAFIAVKGHYLSGMCTFQPPFPMEELPFKLQVQYQWISRNLHQMDWNEGEQPYSKLREILTFLFDLFPDLYVKGLQKRKFLEFLSGRRCFDLEDFDCPKMEHLIPTRSNCPLHEADFKHCAWAKVHAFEKFLKNL